MIRKANINDLNSIKNLLEEILYVHHKLRPDIFKEKGQKFSDDELLSFLKDDNNLIFVYEIDGKVVGHLFLDIKIYNETGATHPYKTLFIEDLSIDEDYRRQGIGKSLMNFAFDYAKTIGAGNVKLHVWEGNTSAIKFYESLGMKPQKHVFEYLL